MKEVIKGELGCIYYYLGNLKKAKYILEEAVKKNSVKNTEKSAQYLKYLGHIYRELANYQKAKNLFEESLVIYKKHCPGN